jgi:hypothetical protein
VYALAGSSLFIYLVHFPLSLTLKSLGVKDMPYVPLVSALVAGYLLWRFWEFVWRQIGWVPFGRKTTVWDSQKEPL